MNVSSMSCPFCSPSLNSEFDSNFQVSSTHDKLFSNYLNSHHECGFENVWSILTHKISYTIDTNLYILFLNINKHNWMEWIIQIYLCIVQAIKMNLVVIKHCYLITKFKTMVLKCRQQQHTIWR